MRTVAFLSAALIAFAYGNAEATQIVNQDETTNYTVTIITPAGKSAIEVAGGAVLDDVCPEGCTLLLGDKNEVTAGADDSVSIEKGKMELVQ